MIVNEFVKITSWGKDKHINLICDYCQIQHSRQLKHYNKMKSNPLWDMDYCNKCWRPKIYNTPEYLNKMRSGVKRAYENPELRKKISAIVTGRNSGDNNPMKRQDVKNKVSKTRKELFEHPIFGPALKNKISLGCKEAWQAGKYIGANTSGESKWYDYQHSNGLIYKVQGQYELKFIAWLDSQGLEFLCHKGFIPYIDKQGVKRFYYPDFFVTDWNSYIDIKSSYWFHKQKDKWDCINEQCKDYKIKILMETELKNLGIKL